MNDKPTYEEYYENGSIHSQSWLKNGKHHRLNDLPAIVWYFKDGNIEYQAWYENGKRHRLNKLPAWIGYHEDGNIKFQEWWENGRKLSDEEIKEKQINIFLKKINKLAQPQCIIKQKSSITFPSFYIELQSHPFIFNDQLVVTCEYKESVKNIGKKVFGFKPSFNNTGTAFWFIEEEL